MNNNLLSEEKKRKIDEYNIKINKINATQDIKDDQTNNLRRERREKTESNIISHFLLREGNERG